MGCFVARNEIFLNFSDFFLISWPNCEFSKFSRQSQVVANLSLIHKLCDLMSRQPSELDSWNFHY